MENYIKAHIFYIILIVVGVVSFKMWLTEHDRAVKAEMTEQQAQQKIVVLQQTIDSAQAAAKVKTQKVDQLVKAAVTPQQKVDAITQLEEEPLNTRVAPELPDTVEVNTTALLQQLGQCKKAEIELQACQVTVATQAEQLKEKDTIITAVKAKPKFWARVKSHGKWAMIGILAYEGVKIWLTHQP